MATGVGPHWHEPKDYGQAVADAGATELPDSPRSLSDDVAAGRFEDDDPSEAPRVITALPGAQIIQLDDSGLHPVDYDDAEPVQLTRAFLDSPHRFLKHLLAEGD